MKENSSTQKVCSFYVSNIHFATMILPFVNKQIDEKINILTFFEVNFTTNIELVLSRLTIKEERKKELMNINWKDTNVTKYFNIEKILKNKLIKNEKNIIIINGSEEYIDVVNECVERFLEKNKKKNIIQNNKIMNFYEVGTFNENIREILDKHELVFNTSGEHKIEDIFEGYKKNKEKISMK